MAFTRIRHGKYIYREERVREGKRVLRAGAVCGLAHSGPTLLRDLGPSPAASEGNTHGMHSG